MLEISLKIAKGNLIFLGRFAHPIGTTRSFDQDAFGLASATKITHRPSDFAPQMVAM